MIQMVWLVFKRHLLSKFLGEMLLARFWLKYPAAENNLSQSVDVAGMERRSCATWQMSVLKSLVTSLKYNESCLKLANKQ